MRHHVYLAPGMFGFGRLASYDYFVHLRRAIEARFADAGVDVAIHGVEVPPTASIRRRSARLVDLVARTAGTDGSPVHLLGHSTGGLDARLVASPTVHLPISRGALDWLPRLASVTTLSTPHYGTPLASFFATVSGQRMLHALSALTFIALSVGRPPLAAVSALVGLVGQLDGALGIELGVLDRSTNAILSVLEPARSDEVRAYLEAIKEDQGAVIQLSPEAMDLFQAGIEDRPGVRYQSTAAMAPAPTVGGIAKQLMHPWHLVSSTLFATLWKLTAAYDERYPCAAPFAGEVAEAALARTFGRSPGARANDGVVPLRSQIWGELIWCGYGDHLDVLGHFPDTREMVHRSEEQGDPTLVHRDWMRSGSAFDRARFDELCDAVVRGMLAAV